MQLTLKDLLSPSIILACLAPFVGFLLRLRDRTNSLEIGLAAEKEKREELGRRQADLEATVLSLRDQMARIEAKLDVALGYLPQHTIR